MSDYLDMFIFNPSEDGCACIVVNGNVVAQGSQFSLRDVEVIISQVDLDAVSHSYPIGFTFSCVVIYMKNSKNHFASLSRERLLVFVDL